MKAAVFSDTHGNNELMLEAARRERPDVLIHLGDYDRDAQVLRSEFPDIPLYSVCGNCDIAPLSPLRDVVPLGSIYAFITHGHAYDVYYGLDSLVYAAQEADSKIALFGHTHRAVCEEIDGVTCLNPGTAGRGRELSYATIEVSDSGAFYCEIKDL